MKIKTLSVYEVNNYVKKILDNDFILNNLSVKGEISNLKIHSSGHIYFSLKDDLSKINCVMFKSNAYDLTFNLEEGMEVVVSGRVSVYPANGSFQVYCNKIQKEGLGELHIRFEMLKQKLERKGYFSSENKKMLPKNINRIGIVTSETGAAIHDIINVIRRRNKFVDIVLFPAQVQGNGAYKTIVSGIEYFNSKKSVDVIIIGRGGGSIEELWNFNEEELAIAIFKSKLPIISAVGHEVDFTISDFVSDIRAATPSQAGEFVSILDKEITERLNIAALELKEIMENKLQVEKNKLENYNRILTLNSPMNKIVHSFIEIDNLKTRLNSNVQNIINKEKNKLISLNNLLMANNPINILGKGYAIINGEAGNYIKNTDEFKEVETLRITLQNGFVKGNFTLLEKGGDLYGKKGEL